MIRRFRPRLVVVLLLLFAVSSPFVSAQQDFEARITALIQKLTLEEKIDLLGGVDGFYIRDVKSIGLPRIKMADGPLGVRNYGPATTFAGGIALASTWDTDLAQRVGKTIGQDARARGVHFMLGPGVNIYRAPMNGRNFEYFGEDPFLASRTAVAYIQGMQSQGVSATAKHFMGNNSEFNRHNSDSEIDERTMREIYLPAFEAAIKEAHVGSIMDSYNLTNGEHLTQNSYLNTDVAKKEWGFDGIMMSDWVATYDGVAAANGGLDLEMPSAAFMNRATLLPAVKSGQVSEATIDDKVRRILRVAIRFGWMDRDQTELSIPRLNLDGGKVALDEAREGMVLLKNDGNLLPLDKNKTKAIAVIGPDAYPAQPIGGGSAGVKPFSAVSFMEGVANYLQNGARVYYAPGVPTIQEMAESTHFETEASGGKPGVTLEGFKAEELKGTPDQVTIARNISYGAGWQGSYGLSSDLRSARWTAYYEAKDSGTYNVLLQGPSEGGRARVFVDGKPAVDNWTGANVLVNYASLLLSPGPHKVIAELTRTRANAQIRVGIINPASIVSAEARALAAKADAVVLAVGFDPTSESEGADRTFALPPGQDELINQISSANKNTIVVLTAGGAVNLNAWYDHVPAVLESWYPGQEGGTALAQLLFGDCSPSGKLPISWEKRWQDNPVHDSYYPNHGDKKIKYTEGVFVGYRHFDKSAIKPMFPFGYGLSYTSFAYKNLKVSPASFSSGQPVAVGFDVTNNGRRAGAEVAQVYVGDQHSGVPRPLKELKGFARITLNPGETKHVTVDLDQRSFSYYDVAKHAWNATPGDFDILVGPSSADIPLSGRVTLH